MSILLNCWDWCLRRRVIAQTEFMASENIQLFDSPKDAKLLLLSTDNEQSALSLPPSPSTPRSPSPPISEPFTPVVEDNAGFWVSSANLPISLAPKIDEEEVPGYLDECGVHPQDQNLTAQVGFFSGSSGVLGLSAARNLKAKLAGVVREGSAAGATWETYYLRKNEKIREILESSESADT